MQTFRAYLRDAAGVITWAAWVEAGDAADARAQAGALRPGQNPSVDLWSATERKLAPSARLDPV